MLSLNDMAKNNPTTVHLTATARAIKEQMVPIFGLKNILSAGLVLFYRLTSDEQKRVIAEANGAAPNHVTEIHLEKVTLREAFIRAVTKSPPQKSGGIQIEISPSDEDAWDDLHEIAGIVKKSENRKKA